MIETQKPLPLRLSVATNFDDDLLAKISAYPVEEVYGKLARDVVGGGRASYSAGPVDRSRLETHVATAHRVGIRFNYLLNAVCLGNREWTREGIRAIRALLDDLSRIGVDGITVSTPYLAELVKRHYPHFSLKTGIFANIDTPLRARFWQDLGADTLVLESFSINRRFPVLEAIRKAVTCDLQLIANFSCLPNCPLQVSHMVGISHGSNDVDRAPFIDYCILKCSSMTLADPSLLVKSNWIRPEDVDTYAKLGYANLKLLERNAPTELLVNRVKAYSARQSPGNLLELIQPFGFNKDIKREWGWVLGVALARPRALFDLYRLLKKRGMLFSLQGSPVRLDAGKIPADFLEQLARRPCATTNDCSGCDYCRSIADRAYHVDAAYRDDCLRLYRRVFKALC